MKKKAGRKKTARSVIGIPFRETVASLITQDSMFRLYLDSIYILTFYSPVWLLDANYVFHAHRMNVQDAVPARFPRDTEI